MKKLIIVTGASGHLGGTIIRILAKADCAVRGLLLPSDDAPEIYGAEYFRGDVRDIGSLSGLFEGIEDFETYVIHTAGIVDISDRVTPAMYAVNVTGTKNMIAMCMRRGVKRLVYVSSVHAIPEKKNSQAQAEVEAFSPELVLGGYAKTKAEATQAVLDAVKYGLDAVVIHPSGIIGPFDNSGNHLVQMFVDFVNDHLPACVTGGYDLVDVRDVAQGCIDACEKGVTGECYILSNKRYEIRDLLKLIKRDRGRKKLIVLPNWVAKALIPFLTLHAKRLKIRPLITRYSLHTLKSNSNFSHDKASKTLGYEPRDINLTLSDMTDWIKNKRKVKVK